MTDPHKILEALRKPVTGNGPELDTIDAWNNALEAAREALEKSGIYGPFTPITVSVRSEPIADADMRCAECDCNNPPYGCNWIKPGPLAEPVGVKVKPLVWWTSDTGDLVCDTLVGRYQIQKGGARYCLMPAMAPRVRRRMGDVPAKSHHRTLEAAMSAAQADYDRRILSALEPGQTLAEAYRAGLGAAAEKVDTLREDAPTIPAMHHGDRCIKAICELPVPPEFDRTTVSEFGGE